MGDAIIIGDDGCRGCVENVDNFDAPKVCTSTRT